MTNDFKIKTHCAHCVFRVNNNDGVQTGCELGRLAIFQQLQVPMKYNELEKSFILETYCNACRNEEWQSKNINKTVAVRQEVTIQYDLIFIIERNAGKYERICSATKRSIESALSQVLKPKTVIIVSDNEQIEDSMGLFTGNVVAPLFKNIKDDIKYEVIKHFHEPDDTYETLVNVGVNRCKYRFFAASPIGQVIPENAFEKLDIAINDKLLQLALVQSSKEQDIGWKAYPSIMLVKVFKKLYDGKIDVEDKLVQLSIEQNCPQSIKKWSDL